MDCGGWSFAKNLWTVFNYIHALCMQVEKPLPEPLMLDYTNSNKISHARSIKNQSTIGLDKQFLECKIVNIFLPISFNICFH